MANDLSVALKIQAIVEGLTNIGALIDEIQQLGGDSAKASQDAGRLGDELNQLAKNQRLVDQFVDLKRELQGTAAALEESRIKTAALGREYNAAEKPTQALASQFTRARNEARQLAEQEERQRLQLQQLRQEMAAAGINAGTLAQSQIGIASKTREAATAVQALTQRLAETRTALTDSAAAAAENRRQLAETAAATNEAFRTLGVRSQAELQAAAGAARQAFDTIRSSGTSPTRDVQQAFRAYARAAIEANGGVASSALKTEAAMLGLGAELDGVAGAFRSLGVRSSAALQAAATTARSAFDTIRASGPASARDVQQAFLAYSRTAIQANDGVVSASLAAED